MTKKKTEPLPPIVCDTREQLPWKFRGQQVEVRALKTGDYSLSGLEDFVCVERKGAAAELAGNLSQKRFSRELDRMAKIPHAYVLCEFPLSDLVAYPDLDEIPWAARKRIRVRGPYLLRRVCEEMTRTGVPFIFCGHGPDHARSLALSLFKRCYQKSKQERP